ncbi:hypothetical protein [Streptomyces sp. NPDC006309]|uniref:hypothetical protein n=1 Tax=Streptomyces sp. NPDC006309 TaxID=3156749 RepID=UPI0033BDF72C
MDQSRHQTQAHGTVQPGFQYAGADGIRPGRLRVVTAFLPERVGIGLVAFLDTG